MTGVDIEPQKNYPFNFIQGDALQILKDHDFLQQFDFIHTSPPCQNYSCCSVPHKYKGKQYPDLIPIVRDLLISSGKPYIIENVSSSPLISPIFLTGPMFGLKVIRRRLFESNLIIPQPPYTKKSGSVKNGEYVTVAGHGGGVHGSTKKWGEAMGINWMSHKELTQAIPPAYTQYIGNHIKWNLKSELSI